MQREIDMLDRDVMRLAQATTYPATPEMATGVRRRLAARPVVATGAPWLRPAAVAAAFVVALVIAVGAVSPARDAVADLFHRINIFETTQSPAGLPRDITGKEVSLEEAQARVGMQLRQPSAPAGLALQRVLVQEYGATVRVAVLFFDLPDGRSFALFESNARVGKGLPAFGKGIPANGAQAQSVAGLGDEAYWVEGLRITQYYDANGNVVPESVRATDANTLLWSQGAMVYRIEGPLTRGEAVEVAESLR